MGKGLVFVDLGGRQIWIKGFAYTSKFWCLPHIAEAIRLKVIEKMKPRKLLKKHEYKYAKKRKKRA